MKRKLLTIFTFILIVTLGSLLAAQVFFYISEKNRFNQDTFSKELWFAPYNENIENIYFIETFYGKIIETKTTENEMSIRVKLAKPIKTPDPNKPLEFTDEELTFIFPANPKDIELIVVDNLFDLNYILNPIRSDITSFISDYRLVLIETERSLTCNFTCKSELDLENLKIRKIFITKDRF
ncbi:MAG: hypothetical protein KatS3mg085_824 [Candidatus Dojkabacteria bacterium]|nr:MAG: hypothetical protein KatS3mg085_824 [Candidatus Dojkabacteria bacterium]GIW58785.1 MAG: hypothetical protein KatS3mg086_070 [Candidatus Dojkabacteria bacterium]